MYSTPVPTDVDPNLYGVVILVIISLIIIAFVILLIIQKIKYRKTKAEHEQAFKEVSGLGLVTLPLGQYRSGLPATVKPDDMLVLVAADALVFYPYKANTIEVARIPLSAITEITVEDKSSSSTTFASGFFVASRTYKRFDVIIKYTTASSRLPEQAVFSFKAAYPRQAATNAVETLKKYIH